MLWVLSNCSLSAHWLLTYSWLIAWRFEPEWWILTDLDKFGPKDLTHISVSWAPIGAKKLFFKRKLIGWVLADLTAFGIWIWTQACQFTDRSGKWIENSVSSESSPGHLGTWFESRELDLGLPIFLLFVRTPIFCENPSFCNKEARGAKRGRK